MGSTVVGQQVKERTGKGITRQDRELARATSCYLPRMYYFPHCRMQVERCWLTTRTGTAIDLQPCVDEVPAPYPTVQPMNADRQMTTRTKSKSVRVVAGSRGPFASRHGLLSCVAGCALRASTCSHASEARATQSRPAPLSLLCPHILALTTG